MGRFWTKIGSICVDIISGQRRGLWYKHSSKQIVIAVELPNGKVNYVIHRFKCEDGLDKEAISGIKHKYSDRQWDLRLEPEFENV